MRSDRLMSLLLLLQARNPRTARELAGLLEVTTRTIYRDVDALGAAGVPIYAERGAAGGIALTDGYRQSLTHFSSEELQAMFVASAQPLADLGVAAADGALRKLAGALSEQQRGAAQKARGRLFLDQNKWYHAKQPAAVLTTLRQATWDDRRVQLVYRDRKGVNTTRCVDPFGLVSKAGVWYLIARIASGDMRSFRAERIVEATVLDGCFERPADFDLEAHWHASLTSLERAPNSFEVVVQMHGEDQTFMPFWDADVVESNRATSTHRLRFSGEESALFQLVSWGTRIEILSPQSLRDAVAQHAEALLARYATRAPAGVR